MMRRQDYELARDELFSSSWQTFHGAAKRFLEVCSKYEPARRALQQVGDYEVDYDKVCESLEMAEDPCPSEASQRIPFLYGLLRVAITRGIDGAALLGHIISGVNFLDHGIDTYRREFLRPLVAYIDRRVDEWTMRQSSGFARGLFIWVRDHVFATVVAGLVLALLLAWLGLG